MDNCLCPDNEITNPKSGALSYLLQSESQIERDGVCWAILLLGIHPFDILTQVHRNICARMSNAVRLIKVKNWN